MKKIIVIAAVLMMAGQALAIDPNELSAEYPVQITVSANVMTVQIYLDAEQAYVYSRSDISEIVKSIKAVLQNRIRRFRSDYWRKKDKETKTEDMK